MAEPRGRAARWQTAMLLIPGAAVTFGATVTWAAGTTPTTTSSSSTPRPTTHRSDRAARVEAAAYRHRLEKQIHEHRQNTHDLLHQLAVLRTRTGQLSIAAPAPVPPVVGAPAPQGPLVVPPPPPPVVVPPPPPPVHTVTGASGHP